MLAAIVAVAVGTGDAVGTGVADGWGDGEALGEAPAFGVAAFSGSDIALKAATLPTRKKPSVRTAARLICMSSTHPLF